MRRNVEKKPGFNLFYLIIIAVILLIILYYVLNPLDKEGAPVAENSKKIELFNGRDLSDWSFYLVDSTVDPSIIYYVQDDVINIEGEPFGYMKTKAEYEDYKLHLEWRWPGEESNSGVFLNITGPDQKWPATIECQLMAGNAGDFVFLGGSDAAERTDKENRVILKIEESNEVTPGEWNAYDIINRNDSIMVYVNGVLQNSCTFPDPPKGHIGLQSEGGPVEFRNVYLVSYN
ncbi:MAG: DUF1080 domain-containing protein [Bacteroidales bacterium]|nr:DUF1080 domain-containing protein [Bacteroidales bacterium]